MGFRTVRQTVTSADVNQLFVAGGADVQAWIQVQPTNTGGTVDGGGGIISGTPETQSLPAWIGPTSGTHSSNGFCLTADFILELGLGSGDEIWVMGSDISTPSVVTALIRFIGTDSA